MFRFIKLVLRRNRHRPPYIDDFILKSRCFNAADISKDHHRSGHSQASENQESAHALYAATHYATFHLLQKIYMIPYLMNCSAGNTKNVKMINSWGKNNQLPLIIILNHYDKVLKKKTINFHWLLYSITMIKSWKKTINFHWLLYSITMIKSWKKKLVSIDYYTQSLW